MIHQLNLNSFVDLLRSNSISRFSLTWDRATERVRSSHPLLADLEGFLESDSRDFDCHEGLFFEYAGLGSGVLLAAFVHNSCRGQGAGGVRRWRYGSFEALIRDGLRLSKGMTRKNALAGLWWGGGKGIIAAVNGEELKEPGMREQVYRAYGRFISSLNGCYVTAEDVGTTPDDMAAIFSRTRFSTCIPPRFGGSGNPSLATARGVVAAMESALGYAGFESLRGRRVAVQGAGNVAAFLMELMLERGVAEITAVDVDPQRVDAVATRFSGEPLKIHAVGLGDSRILEADCDILAPCATGAILNPDSIPNIRAGIICGAANNQLQDSRRDGLTLLDREILYVPDFLANRMGIVNCANEQYGTVGEDPVVERHLDPVWEFSVQQTTNRVLERSARERRPTPEIAEQLADQLAQQQHPIFGHRGRDIIDELVAARWALELDA